MVLCMICLKNQAEKFPEGEFFWLISLRKSMAMRMNVWYNAAEEVNAVAKYFIYSRKSKYSKMGDSVGNQIEMAKRYIFSHFPEATEEEIAVFEDDGFSGKNTRRPDFARMMMRIKAGEPEYLVVYRLDRISRSVSDFSAILALLQKKNIHFVSLNEQFDTSTPLGRVMIVIASAFAQMEREVISERVADNMLELSKRGTWSGGVTPMGFRAKRVASDPERGIMKEHSILEEDPEKFPIVQRMFARYMSDRKLMSVYRYIRNDLGLVMADSVVKNILTNPVYCAADAAAYDYFQSLGSTVIGSAEDYTGEYGIMPYNRHDEDSRKKRDPSSWIISIGRHAPVVDGRTFVTIQNALRVGAQEHPRDQSARNNYALLTGMIVCAKCGGRIYTQPQNSKRSKGGEVQFTYVCNTRKTYGVKACDCPSVSGRRLDKLISEQIVAIMEDEDNSFGRISELRIKRDNRTKTQNFMDAYKKELAAKQKISASIIDEMMLMDKDDPMRAMMKTRLQTISEDIRDIERRMAEAELLLAETDNDVEDYDVVIRSIRKFSDCYDAMTIPERRDMLEKFVEKVTWDGRTAEVFLIGEQ